MPKSRTSVTAKSYNIGWRTTSKLTGSHYWKGRGLTLLTASLCWQLTTSDKLEKPVKGTRRCAVCKEMRKNPMKGGDAVTGNVFSKIAK